MLKINPLLLTKKRSVAQRKAYRSQGFVVVQFIARPALAVTFRF